MEIPDSVKNYIQEIEGKANIKIKILDRTTYPDYESMAHGFSHGDDIYVDFSLTGLEWEKLLYHELTHVYFRYLGFPKTEFIKQINNVEKDRLNKLLTLIEDIAVNEFLAERNLPFNKYDYDKGLKDITAVYNSGTTMKVGSGKYSEEIKFLLLQLLFIQLLISDQHIHENNSLIKSIAEKNLGQANTKFVFKVAVGIKDIWSKSNSVKSKTDMAFRYLIKQFDFKEKVIVKFKA